jgi:hypothetical protein
VELEIQRRLALRGVEELPDLAAAVAVVELADYRAGPGVERGEETDGAMTDLVVDVRFGLPDRTGNTGAVPSEAWVFSSSAQAPCDSAIGLARLRGGEHDPSTEVERLRRQQASCPAEECRAVGGGQDDGDNKRPGHGLLQRATTTQPELLTPEYQRFSASVHELDPWT